MIFRPPPALFFQSNSSDSRAANRIITGRKITAVVAAVLPSRALALAQSACCGAVGLLDRPTDCGLRLLTCCWWPENVRAGRAAAQRQGHGADVPGHRCWNSHSLAALQLHRFLLAGVKDHTVCLMYSAKVCHFVQSWMLRNNYTHITNTKECGIGINIFTIQQHIIYCKASWFVFMFF